MSQAAETHGSQVTSWIPLTTPFTAPTSCSYLLQVESQSLVAFDPGFGVSVDTDALCQPAAVTTSWFQTSVFGQANSPSVLTTWSLLPLICPASFYTAASSEVSGGASTLAFCCPFDYSVVSGSGGTDFGKCQSVVTSGQVKIIFESQAIGFSTITTTFSALTNVEAIAVQGYALASTATASTTLSSSSALSAIAGSTSPAISTGTSSPASSSDSSNSHGLSTGAEAGIGVGAALGVIGIIALIIAILLLRRRKGRTRTEQDHKGRYTESDPVSELGGTSKPQLKQQTQGMYEKDGSGVNELPPEAAVHELDDVPVAELEGHEGSSRIR